MNREQAINIINDFYGMDGDMLRDTIGNGSVSFNDYSDDQLIWFAKFQYELNFGEIYEE